MGRFRNILLDLDGTLIDSREGIFAGIAHVLERLGWPAAAGPLDWFIGPPLQEGIARLLATDDAELTRRGVELYRERYGRTGFREYRPYPGVERLLRELGRAGRTVHLCTTKAEPYARAIVEHAGWSRWFDGVRGATLDGALARKEDLIARVLADHGLAARASAMVGDHVADVRGAQHNGVFAVAVCYGFGTADDLARAGADRLVGSPDELLDVLLADVNGVGDEPCA